MVEHKFGPPVSGRVLAEQCPRVTIDIVAVEVALQGFAVPDRGVQITAQRVDLPPLRVDAHLVAGTCAWPILKETILININTVTVWWHTRTRHSKSLLKTTRSNLEISEFWKYF